MKYLISTVVKYRVDTEEEAKTLIEENKANNMGDITKYSCVYKCQKQKGDVIQDWYEVTLERLINDAKEPDRHIEVKYEVDF